MDWRAGNINNRHDVNDMNNKTEQLIDQAEVQPVLRWLHLFAPKNLFFGLAGVLILLSALAVVVYSYESRNVFQALQQQRALQNDLDVEWGQLLIEQSTFGLEGRIERRASDELNMKLPDWSRIVMVRHE
jgi:cell division protein FtsL